MRTPPERELNMKMERFLNLKPWQIYCDDHARDVPLEERDTRNRRGSFSNTTNSKIIGYFVPNHETGEERYINKKEYEIIYDETCVGCAIYNKETGEQRIVSQEEFEQSYFKWKTN